jgi:hypothetical protein
VGPRSQSPSHSRRPAGYRLCPTPNLLPTADPHSGWGTTRPPELVWGIGPDSLPTAEEGAVRRSPLLSRQPMSNLTGTGPSFTRQPDEQRPVPVHPRDHRHTAIDRHRAEYVRQPKQRPRCRSFIRCSPVSPKARDRPTPAPPARRSNEQPDPPRLVGLYHSRLAS